MASKPLFPHEVLEIVRKSVALFFFLLFIGVSTFVLLTRGRLPGDDPAGMAGFSALKNNQSGLSIGTLPPGSSLSIVPFGTRAASGPLSVPADSGQGSSAADDLSGTTPFLRDDLKPGSYDLELRKAGFWAWRGTFMAEPGRYIDVHDLPLLGDFNSRLEPPPVALSAEPSGTDLLAYPAYTGVDLSSIEYVDIRSDKWKSQPVDNPPIRLDNGPIPLGEFFFVGNADSWMIYQFTDRSLLSPMVVYGPFGGGIPSPDKLQPLLTSPVQERCYLAAGNVVIQLSSSRVETVYAPEAPIIGLGSGGDSTYVLSGDGVLKIMKFELPDRELKFSAGALPSDSASHVVGVLENTMYFINRDVLSSIRVGESTPRPVFQNVTAARIAGNTLYALSDNSLWVLNLRSGFRMQLDSVSGGGSGAGSADSPQSGSEVFNDIVDVSSDHLVLLRSNDALISRYIWQKEQSVFSLAADGSIPAGSGAVACIPDKMILYAAPPAADRAAAAVSSPADAGQVAAAEAAPEYIKYDLKGGATPLNLNKGGN